MQTKTKQIKFFLSLVIGILILNCGGNSADYYIRIPKDKIKVRASSEKFFEETLPSLAGKNIVLVTNPSGIGNNPDKLIAKFNEQGIKIKYLIGLEHGFFGMEEDFSSTPVTIDSTFNLPIYHIYRLKPVELKIILSTKVDAIIFDVQDMGMRCYTYLTVLKRLMDQMDSESQLIVLDHPSPGMEMPVAGDEIKQGYENFAGDFPSLFFTGLSMGESANYYNSEVMQNKVNLKVVPVENYRRGMRFEETGLPWYTPSPNLPTLDSARNYMALVLLEGINVSVGRGTQAPFVYFGAPWMKDTEEIVNALNESSGKNYYFQQVFFKPAFGPYKDKICRGLRMNLVNANYDPLRLAYNLIKLIKEKYKKECVWNGSTKFSVDSLWGNDGFRKAIDSGLSYNEFRSTFSQKEEEYAKKIRKYYMY